MIKLYTWGPTTPETVMSQAAAPDIGHSALEVTDAGGNLQVYASFWPERDSLIGRITQLWKHRQARSPTSYAQEIDPHQGYMQREADHADEIYGIDEAAVVQLWNNLKSTEYDFLRWNCASVCKMIILGSAPSEDAAAQEIAASVSELARLHDPEELLAALKKISASPLAVSHPEELRHLAEAYAASHELAAPPQST